MSRVEKQGKEESEQDRKTGIEDASLVKWPSGGGCHEADSCALCGYPFSSVEAVKEEEVGLRCVNADICFDCAGNLVHFHVQAWSVKSTHDFIMHSVTGHQLSYDTRPVAISLPWSGLTDDERELVKGVESGELPARFEEVSLEQLDQSLVDATAPRLAGPSGSASKTVPECPKPLVIGLSSVYTPHPSLIKSTLGDTDSVEGTEQMTF